MVTDYLHLYLTGASEDTGNFLAWRTKMNGTGEDSNMVIIDNAIRALAESISSGSGGGGSGEAVGIDTTLTQVGKAAEAKAVGDALNNKLNKTGGTLSGKITLPTGNENCGFVNSGDVKIIGYGGGYFKVGDVGSPLQFRGSGANPLYGNKKILLEGDVTVPQKGVNYFTASEIEDIVDSVIAGLPVYSGEVV